MAEIGFFTRLCRGKSVGILYSFGFDSLLCKGGI
jgi:hypothetical protein